LSIPTSSRIIVSKQGTKILLSAIFKCTNKTVVPKMSYSLDDALLKFAPGKLLKAEPLEFDWDEAENAILFSSSLRIDNFHEWNEHIRKHIVRMLPEGASIKVEPDEGTSCTSFWISTSEKMEEYINPELDIHVAWGGNKESYDNLNAWIGSSVFDTLIADKPPTAGMVRTRP